MASEFKEKGLGENPVPQAEFDNTGSCFSEWTTIIPDEEKVEVPGGLKAPRFNPRAVGVELIRYGVTGAISFFSSSGLEAVALVGASLAASLNPLAGQDSKVAIAALALSYIPLITGTLQNANQAWNLLKKRGRRLAFWPRLGMTYQGM